IGAGAVVDEHVIVVDVQHTAGGDGESIFRTRPAAGAQLDSCGRADAERSRTVDVANALIGAGDQSAIVGDILACGQRISSGGDERSAADGCATGVVIGGIQGPRAAVGFGDSEFSTCDAIGDCTVDGVAGVGAVKVEGNGSSGSRSIHSVEDDRS